MRLKAMFVGLSVVLVALLLLVIGMLWPGDNQTTENEQLRDRIEDASGRSVPVGRPIDMYYEAIHVGDSVDYVLKILASANIRALREADGTVVQVEIAFDSRITQDFLAVRFDETGHVTYVGIQ